MPKLILNASTPQAHREFLLKPGKNFIGRAFANDFKLDDASVSGSHALIMVEGAMVTVKDLGSTNGTRINQLPATGSPLQSGQVVSLARWNCCLWRMQWHRPRRILRRRRRLRRRANRH